MYGLALILSAGIAITFHEFAHAFAALKCGDGTAKANGRLTVNPVAHFELYGFLMMLLVGFGWAKPVPINPSNFTDYKKGTVLVSVAGVIMNLLLCFFAVLLLYLFSPIIFYHITRSDTAYIFKFFAYYFLYFIASVNFMLAFFNLLPICPLDGFRLLDAFLKPGNAYSSFMYKRGNIILLALIILSSVFSAFGLYYLDIFYWVSTLIQRLIFLAVVR